MVPDTKYMKSYKGVYYYFAIHDGVEVWHLSREFINGLVMDFISDFYRLDQCFDEFFSMEQTLKNEQSTSII